jgi:tRNA(adenine34) deaminase
MPFDHDHYMRLCIELSKDGAAKGNRPIGSLIVDAEGGIVAQGANRANTDMDPTAHAEMVAIREAARRLGTLDLSGCTIYTSMEPCPMCCWAIIESGISRLVMGGRLAGIGRRDMGRYSTEAMLELVARPLELVTGVRARECEELRMAWAAERAARGLPPR